MWGPERQYAKSSTLTILQYSTARRTRPARSARSAEEVRAGTGFASTRRGKSAVVRRWE